jgi:solute carrier family 50 protein (sugar transporter)
MTYLAMYANSMLWCAYGYLQEESIIMLQNLFSFLLATYSVYLLYKMNKTQQPKVELKPEGFENLAWSGIAFWTSLVFILILMVKTEMIYVNTVGRLCILLAIVQFAAPLMVMKQVLSQGYNGGLIDPQLSVLLLIMGTSWSLYGNFLADINVIVPNFIGALLAAVQVFLTCIVPPTKDGWPSCSGKACCQKDNEGGASNKMEV